MKSPRLIVSISCSVTLMTSCLRNRTPSSSSILLLLLLLLTLLLMLEESEDSLVDLSSDPSVLTFAITLLPVRTVNFRNVLMRKNRNIKKKEHTRKVSGGEHGCEDCSFQLATSVEFLQTINSFLPMNSRCDTFSLLWVTI